jgi:hypothetical protein
MASCPTGESNPSSPDVGQVGNLSRGREQPVASHRRAGWVPARPMDRLPVCPTAGSQRRLGLLSSLGTCPSNGQATSLSYGRQDAFVSVVGQVGGLPVQRTGYQPVLPETSCRRIRLLDRLVSRALIPVALRGLGLCWRGTHGQEGLLTPSRPSKHVRQRPLGKTRAPIYPLRWGQESHPEGGGAPGPVGPVHGCSPESCGSSGSGPEGG